LSDFELYRLMKYQTKFIQHLKLKETFSLIFSYFYFHHCKVNYHDITVRRRMDYVISCDLSHCGALGKLS
jgi:hypothetical protein